MIRVVVSVLSSAFALTIAACAKDAVPPPAVAKAAPAAAPAPTSVQIVTFRPSPGVNVSDELRRTCEIGLDNIERAPKFAFDKSDLQPEEKSILEEVASCVMTGPLKGRSLRLVGRADPRGEKDYNVALGHERARSVSSYLTELGVDASSISTTSRGNLDATGYDEATWQLDRRVDIGLD